MFYKLSDEEKRYIIENGEISFNNIVLSHSISLVENYNKGDKIVPSNCIIKVGNERYEKDGNHFYSEEQINYHFIDDRKTFSLDRFGKFIKDTKELKGLLKKIENEKDEYNHWEHINFPHLVVYILDKIETSKSLWFTNKIFHISKRKVFFFHQTPGYFKKIHGIKKFCSKDFDHEYPNKIFPEEYNFLFEPLDFFNFLDKFNQESVLNYTEKDFVILKNLRSDLEKKIKELKDEFDKIEEKKSKERKLVVSKIQEIISKEFDKNNNGDLDILEGENLLIDLLKKNESLIIEFDHNLISDIIKLNEFLNTKKKNLLKMFKLIYSLETEDTMNHFLETFRLSIDNYQTLLIHSIYMLTSIKEKKLSIYYEIRHHFDKINIFNSNWESEVSDKLTDINFNLNLINNTLNDIILSINNLERSISFSLNNINFSLNTLENSVVKELKGVRRGIGLNNLLTGLNTYQLYSLNKNTKSLRK